MNGIISFRKNAPISKSDSMLCNRRNGKRRKMRAKNKNASPEFNFNFFFLIFVGCYFCNKLPIPMCESVNVKQITQKHTFAKKYYVVQLNISTVKFNKWKEFSIMRAYHFCTCQTNDQIVIHIKIGV